MSLFEPDADPVRRRLLLGALLMFTLGLVAFLPVRGIDPLTGARTSAAAQAAEERVIDALETIAGAQQALRRDVDGDGLVEFGTLADLRGAGLIDADLASGRAHGYVLEVRPSPANPEFKWMAVANPEKPGVTGVRSFVVNHAGLVHAVAGRALTLTDDCLIPADAKVP